MSQRKETCCAECSHRILLGNIVMQELRKQIKTILPQNRSCIKNLATISRIRTNAKRSQRLDFSKENMKGSKHAVKKQRLTHYKMRVLKGKKIFFQLTCSSCLVASKYIYIYTQNMYITSCKNRSLFIANIASTDNFWGKAFDHIGLKLNTFKFNFCFSRRSENQ